MIRYRGLVVGVFLILVCTQTRAQQRRSTPPASPSQLYQQVQNQLSSTNNPDSLIEYYTGYALKVYRFEPDSISSIINKIQALDALSFEKKKAHIDLIKTHYYKFPEPDSALLFSRSALSLFKQLGDEKKISGLLNAQAQIYGQLNDYLSAEEVLIRAINLVQEQDGMSSSDEMGYLLNALASLYLRVGATEIAQERYQQMLEIETTREGECRVRINVSNTYKSTLEFERAKSYLEPCLNYEISLPIKITILKSYSDLEKLQGNSEKRLFYIKQAIELQKETRYEDVTSYLFLAEAYYDNAEFSKSDSILTRISTKALTRVQPFVRINFNILKAKLLIKNEEFESALKILDETVVYFQRLPETPLKVEVLLLKAETYKGIGDYELAYETVIATREVSELVKNRAKVREEANSKVRFQMRAKNQELAQVTTELGTVKTRNAVIIFLLLIVGFYLMYRYKVHFLLKEEHTRNKIARDLHDDLSATLSSISFFSEAAKRERSKAEDPDKFLHLIDESATEAKDKINDIIWAIEPENDDWIAFLSKCKRYAAEMFESKEIAYEIDIDTELKIPFDIEVRQDLWLIFKEMVTNIVRHSKAEKATISLSKESRSLVLTVSDDGVGIDESLKKSGNGISNINYRAEKLGCSISLQTTKGLGSVWELKMKV